MAAKTKQSQNAHRLFLVTVAAQKARQKHANRFAVGRSQFAGYAIAQSVGQTRTGMRNRHTSEGACLHEKLPLRFADFIGNERVFYLCKGPQAHLAVDTAVGRSVRV